MRLQHVAFLLFAMVRVNAACQQTADLPSPPKPAPPQRFEVGVLYNNLGLNTCNREPGCPSTPPHNSVGVSVALNMNQHWAIDTSYDFTAGLQPLGTTSFYNGSVAGGRGSKALVGGRFNLRGRRYSLFAYGKTGAVSWSEIQSQTDKSGTIFPINFMYGAQTYFAIGAGGGLEYSLTPWVRVRGSVGDLVVDYRRDRYSGCSLCFDGKGTAWDHNSDASIGIYAGLGRSMPQRLNVATGEQSHHFFDKTNVAVLGVYVLAQSADAVGTQHFIQHGFEEQDGLVRPLVNQGWPGQVGLMMIESGAGILAMYGLHHLGHHRLEHLLPLVLAGPNADGAYVGLKNWEYYGSK